MSIQTSAITVAALVALVPLVGAATMNLGENIDCSGSSCEFDEEFENHLYEFTVHSGAGQLVIKSRTHLDEGGDKKANRWQTQICVDWYASPALANPLDKCKTKTTVEGTYGGSDEYDYDDYVEWTGDDFPTDGEYYATIKLKYWTWTAEWDHDTEQPGEWGEADEEGVATATLKMVWGSCLPCKAYDGVIRVG